MNPLTGVLVVDKPAGMTSAAVVRRVKRSLGVKRIGHTGTLDPMATGVLPLCLGEATKVAGYLLADDKTYEGQLELGLETDTLDIEGEVTRRDPDAGRAVTETALGEVMTAFVGPGQQVPPMYSALKHQGKRLHELARAGREVVREPRPIVIHQLDLLHFRSPRADFSVHCSKGTYVRSLVADIGARLGCGACLTALRRVQSGPFRLANSLQLSEITIENIAGRLMSPSVVLAHLPALVVPKDLVSRIANGQRLPVSKLMPSGEAPPVAPSDGPEAVLRLVLEDGELLALASIDGRGQLAYRRVFTYGLTKRP